MAKIISGKELSARLKAVMAAQVAAFPEQYGRVPHLVVILVGDNPASVSYVTGKAKAAAEVGIRNTTLRRPETISEAELLGLIAELNADADVDGSHIATLIMTFFFRRMPDIIQNGHLYIATPPLYLVKKGPKQQYCWTEEQRLAAVEEFGSKGVHIQRYKGLGEMDAEQLWETTMNPAGRTLRQVTIENATEADRIFSMLMGDDVPPRREFIERNARYAKIDA